MNNNNNSDTITLPTTLLEFWKACDCDMLQALRIATEMGYRLNKHPDPTEGAREGLTIEDAHEVATEDSGLIYLSRA